MTPRDIFFETLTGEPGRDITLANVYYDTPDLALARSKSAVRVRRTPQGWLQTFKTVGSAEGGLHRRHEWELPVAGDALEIDALVAACDVPEAAAALNDAAGSLSALFRTDFSRTLWRIAIGGATVEAAVDLGEIVVQAEHETRREPISEIELELIDGPEAALATLAAELQQALPGLVPENISRRSAATGCARNNPHHAWQPARLPARRNRRRCSMIPCRKRHQPIFHRRRQSARGGLQPAKEAAAPVRPRRHRSPLPPTSASRRAIRRCRPSGATC